MLSASPGIMGSTSSRACPDCGKPRTLKTYPARAQRCRYCARSRKSTQAHASRIEATYEITAEEYALIKAVQGGACGACGEPRRYRLHVDHDHAVEQERGTRASVRGLLCARCNKLLRDCRDSIPLLRALISYLESPPAREVLDDGIH